MSSAKRVYLDYRIPKNSGSRPSDFYNEQVRAGHPCELFIQDDGSYKIFVSTSRFAPSFEREDFNGGVDLFHPRVYYI